MSGSPRSGMAAGDAAARRAKISPSPSDRAPASVPDGGQRTIAATSSSFRWVAYGAVLCTYILIIMGAVVRASGSGLGCPDWPLCYGRVVPPGQTPAMIEYSHRFIGGITSLFILATCILWANAHRWSARVVGGAIIVGILLLLQIALGAVTVELELPSYVVLVHLGMAVLLLGILIFIAADASPAPDVRGAAPTRRFRNLAIGGMAAVFVLVLTGANVRATGASLACAGFPLCNGQLAPFGINRLVDLQLLHRFFAYLVAAHLLVIIVRAWRNEAGTPALRTVAALVLLALVAQISIGAAMVSTGVPALAQVLHVAGAAALWAAISVLTAVVWRARATAGMASPRGAP